MSRIANNPVQLPKGVEVSLSGQEVSVKGAKGSLSLTVHQLVQVKQEDDRLLLSAAEASTDSKALAGTFRALVNNMVVGVSDGFAKELELQGVGYRAQVRGKTLNLSLGLS
ncbi:MAG: 50S ribosomal protein L6, partial [Pseudomonadales bacterium]